MKFLKSSLIIFTILFIVVFPHLGVFASISMAYVIPIVLMVWICLRINKENFADVGFSFKSFSLKSLLIGSLFAVAIVCFMQGVFFPLLDQFMQFENVDVELYNELRSGGTIYFLIVLVLSWVIGGLYESIVFHGFIFTQLEKLISGKYKTVISFLITSFLFGAYHFHLGLADAINAGVVGVGYLALYLFYDRNLWYTIICHCVYNTIVITLLHLGYI